MRAKRYRRRGMIDEMKINAIQREKYLSKGYWKDITLLDCWKNP
ncbi:MAG: hypothetical protein ACLR0U_14460 [Enterocloster clostridioformis]